MIPSVRILLKAFLDIIFLRKGPAVIPHSSLLLMVSTGMFLLVGFLGVAIDDTYTAVGLLLDLVLTATGIGLYSVVINIFGAGERFLRALIAILGCNATLGFASFLGQLVLTDMLNVEDTTMYSQLILLWSIIVEGHIVARTVDRPRIIGILVALAVFFAQVQVFVVIKPLFGS